MLFIVLEFLFWLNNIVLGYLCVCSQQKFTMFLWNLNTQFRLFYEKGIKPIFLGANMKCKCFQEQQNWNVLKFKLPFSLKVTSQGFGIIFLLCIVFKVI